MGDSRQQHIRWQHAWELELTVVRSGYANDETEDAITLTLAVATRLEQEIDRCSWVAIVAAFCGIFRTF